MLIVPLQPVPNQTVTVSLANQTCRINVYQKDEGLFLDLYVNDVLIIGGVICYNLTKIVRSLYLGFIGDLGFIDNNASANVPATDPVYSGLGSRYSLAYLELADLAGQG
jgi:hypothetical protein